ncbi:MAG: hypothetical protein R3A47_01135 [Polyangiales bacterium]
MAASDCDRGHCGADDHRGFVDDRRGFAGGHRGFVGDHRGFVGDHRGLADDRRGFVGDHRGYADDRRGFVGDHRGHAVDHRGFAVDHRGFAVDHRGFAVDHRDYVDGHRDYADDHRDFADGHRGRGCSYADDHRDFADDRHDPDLVTHDLLHGPGCAVLDRGALSPSYSREAALDRVRARRGAFRRSRNFLTLRRVLRKCRVAACPRRHAPDERARRHHVAAMHFRRASTPRCLRPTTAPQEYRFASRRATPLLALPGQRDRARRRPSLQTMPNSPPATNPSRRLRPIHAQCLRSANHLQTSF